MSSPSTAAVSPNPTTSSSSLTSSSSTSSTSTLPTTTTSSTTSIPTSTSQSTTSTTSLPDTTSTTSTAPPIASTSTTSTTSIPPTTVYVTSTSSQTEPSQTQTSGTATSTSASATGTSLATSPAASSDSHGLSAGGTIAVAVVVPVVSVGLIICVLIWWWRRRKANKLAEEERRKEVEEYGFNPNNDPSLPGVGGAAMSSTYSDRHDHQDGNSGYRGWGTTSHPRNPSTNLSSGAGMSIPMSETGSAAGYGRHTASPNDGPVQYSDGAVRPDSGEVGAAGANNGDIRRGTSNASSAYSAGVHSEGSEDAHMMGAGPNHYYDENNPYYHDGHPSQAPYGDSYGTAAPVIRDVQARRNTRIENAGVYPQQGNAGIAQNF